MTHMMLFFCFNQKTADEMRISDWNSDVCSSDLELLAGHLGVEDQLIVIGIDPHHVGRGRAVRPEGGQRREVLGGGEGLEISVERHARDGTGMAPLTASTAGGRDR